MVTGVELTKMQTSSVLVESLDVLVKPDVLAADGRYALRLELDLLDRILRHEVASRSASLDQEL